LPAWMHGPSERTSTTPLTGKAVSSWTESFRQMAAYRPNYLLYLSYSSCFIQNVGTI
jgi:hypothetical protein